MKNSFKVLGSTTELYVKTHGRFLVVLIDTEDLERVKAIPGMWTASRSRRGRSDYYIQYRYLIRGKSKKVYLHRLVAGAEQNEEVDHIHHNTLDNRKSELRRTTPSGNHLNSKIPINNRSGFLGVSWHSARGKWRSVLKYKGKQIFLGYFCSKRAAAKAYGSRKADLLERELIS